MQSINLSYMPRVLGIYYDLSRRTYHRLIYPFRQLADEGRAVGWAENIRLCDLSSYDMVIFLESDTFDIPQEDLAYVRKLGKPVLIDGRSKPLGDPGIDHRIWPEIPERETTIGLFVDRPGHFNASGLLKAVEQTGIPLVGGYHANFQELHTIQYPEMNVYRHPDRINGASILLLPFDDPRPYDVWEAGMAQAIVIANESYRPYLGRYGYYVQNDNWADAIHQALTDKARSARYRRQLHFYVTEHRSYLATLGSLTRLWASEYREKIGLFHTIKAV